MQTLFISIREKYDLPDVFYMDMWPISWSFIVVVNPKVVDQALGVKSHRGLLKPETIKQFMQPIVSLLAPGLTFTLYNMQTNANVQGGRETNLVSADGAEWKKWRSVFNPGFSASHLMTLVPGIVEDVAVFKDLMLQKGKSREIFRLEKPCTRLTLDIIGKVVL